MIKGVLVLIVCIVVGRKYMMNGSTRNGFTSDLLPNEKVLAVCRKNWTCFLNRNSIIGGSIGFLIGFIFGGWILGCIFSLPGVLIPTILEYKNTELVLTSERLRGKQGAFNIRTVENKAEYFVGNVKTESNAILSALYSLGSNREIHIVNRF